MAKTADAKTREKLKEYRDRLQALRGDRARLRQERDQAREAASDLNPAEEGIFDRSEFKQLEGAVAALGRCEDEINSVEGAERLLLSSLNGTDPATHTNGNGDGAGLLGAGGWNGRTLLENSDTYRAAREAGTFHSDAHFGTLTLGHMCDRDAFAGFLRHAQEAPSQAAALPPAAPSGPIGTWQGAVVPDSRGIQPVATKPLTLLDVIPTGTTDSNIVEYVQVTAIPGSAAEVAEGAMKPEEGITFQDATAPVRTIAGWIKLLRQAMDDMAGLVTIINTLLPYDVRRRLESQILVGDGQGQNILGLLNTTGVGAVAGQPGDTVADAILRGLTTVVLSDQAPNFVTLNPVTWQDLAISKASGSGEYMFGYPGMYNSPSIWGLAVTQNRLIDPNKPLVGDATGAAVLVREGVNLKTSDADQDDFVKNRVTVLAETRAAFVVWRPSAFAVVDISGIGTGNGTGAQRQRQLEEHEQHQQQARHQAQQERGR
jgi:HK97 family phage major capsid protein